MALKDFGKKDQLRPAAFSEAPKTLYGPRGMPVEYSDELQRVLDLPRRPPVDLESVEAQVIVDLETARYARDRTGLGPCRCAELDPGSPCITRLLPVQAVALREIRLAGGFWGSLNTGAGKSLIDILALLALAPITRGLLLVPSNLMKQIFNQWQLYAEHWHVPKVIVHHGKGDIVAESPTGQKCILRVMSHNGISSPKQSDFIEKIKPEVLIIDESDAFADLTSSRTIRLNRFMQANDETIVVNYTGSPSDQRIEEMAHLIVYALKERAPVPIATTIVQDWGRAVNAVDCPCPAGALEALIGPQDEGDNDTEVLRAAFSRRLEETLGIMMTTSSDVEITGGTGLVGIEVIPREGLEIPARVQEALEMVRNGERPDTMFGNKYNEIFDDPKEKVRCAREVSCGMFYRWRFPRGESREVIDRWYEARRAWNSELYAKILKGEKYLDSKFLCETAAKRFHKDIPVDPRYPVWESKHWPEWRKVKDTVKPEPAVCRIDPFLVDDAIEWAQDNVGIIWYSNLELARWIAERSKIPIYGGGADAEERIDQLIRAPGDPKSIAASINSHGRGRDGLQKRYSKQLILNVPSSSKRNQQLYARLHRRHQRAEVVESWIYIHTPELESAHRQALRRANYVESVLKQKQKLKMGVRSS